MGRRRILTLGAVCLVFALTACGSSSSKSGGSNDNGGGGGSGSGQCQLDGPLKIDFLWEIKGESANGIDDFQDGASLAVHEINAAGGVCGQKIEAKRITASSSDPQKAVASYLQAVDDKPTAILGPVSNPSALAVAAQSARYQIPVLVPVPADAMAYGTKGGSEYAWLTITPSASVAGQSAQFALDVLHAKKPAFIGTNEGFGTDSLNKIKAALKGTGVSLVASRQFAPGTQDLTDQVLAVKNADVILDFGYPNDVGLAVRQEVQNGISAPTIDSGSAQIAVGNDLIPKGSLDKIYATVPCDSHTANRPQMTKFADGFKARYPNKPLPYSGGVAAYDAVKLVAAAVEKAKSADPTKVNDTLGTLRYTDGACQSEYRADGAHIMAHENVTVHYKPDGTAAIEKVWKLDDVAKGDTP